MPLLEQQFKWNVTMFLLSIFRENEIDKGAELTAALVNTSVDLKFFPDAPVEAENRVSLSLLIIINGYLFLH